MPRGDRTGPVGMGPMTGRAAGYCTGYPEPGFMNPIGGRGYRGRGRGFWCRGGGRGFRHWYYATGLPGWARAPYSYPAMDAPADPYGPYPGQGITAKQELQGLKQQAEYFESSLNEIKKRIQELGLEKE